MTRLIIDTIKKPPIGWTSRKELANYFNMVFCEDSILSRQWFYCLFTCLILFFFFFFWWILLALFRAVKGLWRKKVQKNSERNFPKTRFEKDTAPTVRPWAQDREEHIFLGKKKRRIHLRIGFPYRVKRVGAYVRFDIL